jgi:anti-anti-sigma regulatory factor
MALTISQQDNTITLEGSLNANTINNFKNHFGYILKTQQGITVNLDKVIEIDINGINEFKAMYKKAILNQNMFFVIGKGSDSIYEDFKYPCLN